MNNNNILIIIISNLREVNFPQLSWWVIGTDNELKELIWWIDWMTWALPGSTQEPRCFIDGKIPCKNSVKYG